MLRKFLILSGLMPLLGIFSGPPSVMLFLYSFFILVYFYGQQKWQFFVTKGNIAGAIITTAFLVLFLTETLAWLNNYFEGFKNPGALFSTNYIEDLLIGSGFYLGMTAVWLLLNRFFFFTVTQAFVTYGLLGIFLEQGGAVFRRAVELAKLDPGLSLLLVLLVFLVHGSILGLIHLRLAPRFTGMRRTIWRYPIAVFGIWAAVSLGTTLSSLLAKGIF